MRKTPQVANRQQSWAEWLAEPAGTGTSSPAVVADAIERATGGRPVSIERLLHGEINEVYDVTESAGQRVVVRTPQRSAGPVRRATQPPMTSITTLRRLAPGG